MTDDPGKAGSETAAELKLRIQRERAEEDRAREERAREQDRVIARLEQLEVEERRRAEEKARLLSLLNSSASTPPFHSATAATVELAAIMKLDKLMGEYKLSERYTKLRYKTRLQYDSVMNRLLKELGPVALSALTAERLREYFNEITKNGTEKLTGAQGRLVMLKVLGTFGVEQNIPGAAPLNGVMKIHLKDLFKPVEKRSTFVTVADNAKIKLGAHKARRPSIALAQSFQHGKGLRQKDCIGDWEPIGEHDTENYLVHEGFNWTRGIRWEKLDQNLILHHVRAWDSKELQIDLRKHQDIIAELKIIHPGFDGKNRGGLPAHGPIIICEYTGVPWKSPAFRREWRRIARSCGIPDTVWNGDSRIGAEGADEVVEDLHETQRDALTAPSTLEKLH